jgi:hypothetical protein
MAAGKPAIWNQQRRHRNSSPSFVPSENKQGDGKCHPLVCFSPGKGGSRSLELDGPGRANVITGPAISAGILIDYMGIILYRDRFTRTNIDTVKAVDAIFVDEMLGHSFLLN